MIDEKELLKEIEAIEKEANQTYTFSHYKLLTKRIKDKIAALRQFRKVK